jgi:hypothetical protein
LRGVVTGQGLLEHLGDDDLRLLAAQADPPADPAELRRDPERVARLLAAPGAFDAVMARSEEALVVLSPFLVFAVMVERATAELAGATFVEEWAGPRQRLPVFAVDELREFLADAARRFFLAELLASYSHVASGSVWVRTGRGWRRHRFSELDPSRLASLLDVVPEVERPGVYRRLGDLALFLTGVFPDHTAVRGLSPVGEERLRRATHLPEEAAAPASAAEPGASGVMALLEQVGERSYRAVVASVPEPRPWTLRVLADVGGRFRSARRILNFVTDRYLFPFRPHWFGAPAN